MNEIDRAVFTISVLRQPPDSRPYLPRKWFHAGSSRVRRLMGIMGLQASTQGPNTSKKAPTASNLPIPAEKVVLSRARTTFCAVDITFYIPLRAGCPLPGWQLWIGHAQGAWHAALEHAGRQLLCRGLKEAIAKYGKPGS